MPLLPNPHSTPIKRSSGTVFRQVRILFLFFSALTSYIDFINLFQFFELSVCSRRAVSLWTSQPNRKAPRAWIFPPPTSSPHTGPESSNTALLDPRWAWVCDIHTQTDNHAHLHWGTMFLVFQVEQHISQPLKPINHNVIADWCIHMFTDQSINQFNSWLLAIVVMPSSLGGGKT